jgi:hypothetical protein
MACANTPKGTPPRSFSTPGSESGRRGCTRSRCRRPRTGWLAGQLAEDSRGFLPTGTGIPATALGDQAAAPLFLETSRPGIFAVGDVRSGSVKRAAAIGEGSMAVRLVFDRLKSTGSTRAIELGPRLEARCG